MPKPALSRPDTTDVSVRSLPNSVLDYLADIARAEGVKPSDGAMCLYAITQFVKIRKAQLAELQK